MKNLMVEAKSKLKHERESSKFKIEQFQFEGRVNKASERSEHVFRESEKKNDTKNYTNT